MWASTVKEGNLDGHAYSVSPQIHRALEKDGRRSCCGLSRSSCRIEFHIYFAAACHAFSPELHAVEMGVFWVCGKQRSVFSQFEGPIWLLGADPVSGKPQVLSFFGRNRYPDVELVASICSCIKIVYAFCGSLDPRTSYYPVQNHVGTKSFPRNLQFSFEQGLKG